jgi:hypothetical protein
MKNRMPSFPWTSGLFDFWVSHCIKQYCKKNQNGIIKKCEAPNLAAADREEDLGSCNITLPTRAGADGAVSAGRLGGLKYSSVRGRMVLPP